MSYVKKGGGKLPPIPTKKELENAGIKIAVAVPMERTIQDAAFMHFWAIAMQGYPYFARMYGRTDLNRNEFAKALLESDYTHVFMMDADHLHAPNIVEHHARWILEDPNKLVVGGIHFRRGEPFDPCAFVRAQDGKLYAPVDWPQGLMKVDAIGHGTLLVSRKVFEQLQAPWWAYTYSGVAQWQFPSEDLWFCHLCNEAGIDLWCDTTITSPHLIQSTVDENAFRMYLKDHPQIAAGKEYKAPENGARKKIANFSRKELVR